MNNQENAEKTTIYSKLKEYGDSDFYPYHMPGHKRGEGNDFLKHIAKIDITEIDGFDNLHNAEGIIKNAQDKIAKACGVKKSYMLVNGSTCGVLAAISAAVPQNGKLLIVRNAHKSAYNAMILRDIDPEYLYPSIDEIIGVCDAITAEQVKNKLVEISNGSESGVSAVFIVSPTYEGKIADVKAIADVVHSYNIPLIVDEAHGAHLPFATNIEGYGQSACQAGADIVIQSAHKTLPAPTQTAVLHICSERVDTKKIENYLHIYETSSPSYLLMAGLEAAYDLMAQNGESLLIKMKDCFLKLVDTVNNECKVIKAFWPKDFGKSKQDIGKLVIYTEENDITGKKIADILREKYHLETELSGDRYLLAMFTVGDTLEGYERMARALIEIDSELQTNSKATKRDGITIISEPIAEMSLSEAFDAKCEKIELVKALDRVSADFVMLYPPGVPILAPGEKVTKEHITTIKDYLEKELQVIGLEDEKISVI